MRGKNGKETNRTGTKKMVTKANEVKRRQGIRGRVPKQKQ